MNLTPDQNKAMGLILIAYAVFALVAGVFVMNLTAEARASTAERFTEAQQSCSARLAALGGNIEEIPGRIVWSKSNLEEGPTRLGEASVAAVLCPGWQLKTACIGQECPDPGEMRVTLEPMHPAAG